MRLSTTVNFFIAPDLGDLDSCEKDMERYASLGFKYLDAIFCSAGAEGSPLRRADWETWIKQLSARARNTGICFVQSHVPFYNFTDPAALPCPDIDEIIDRSIISAGILGAEWTVAHPATQADPALAYTQSKQANLEYFDAKLRLAGSHGVGIALENMADFSGGGKKRSYCATAEELCELIDTLRSSYDNVGACWDFGHANLMYSRQDACLRMLGDRLKVTHVHDNCGVHDDHLCPFRGTADWPLIMRTLAEIGYSHDFSFEVRRILQPYVPESVRQSLWRHLKCVGDCLMNMYENEKARQTI